MKRKEEVYAPIWELSDLWANLTGEERRDLTNHIELVHYAKNEHIHSEGDESQYMWMLLKGKVRIY